VIGSGPVVPVNDLYEMKMMDMKEAIDTSARMAAAPKKITLQNRINIFSLCSGWHMFFVDDETIKKIHSGCHRHFFEDDEYTV